MISLNFTFRSFVKALFWDSWFGKICWNLHTSIWKSFLISRELKNVSALQANHPTKNLVTRVFHRCSFSGTFREEEKRQEIRDALQREFQTKWREHILKSKLSEQPRVNLLNSLVQAIDLIDTKQGNCDANIIQIKNKYPVFTVDELWNLSFLKLENGSLLQYSIKSPRKV